MEITKEIAQEFGAGCKNQIQLTAATLRIKELEEQNAALAAMHVDNVRHIWESRNCGSCEELAEKHDALNATVAALRKFIESGSPINTNPDKCERRKLLAATPQHHLRQLRADAYQSGFVKGAKVANESPQICAMGLESVAKQYADRIRQGEVE